MVKVNIMVEDREYRDALVDRLSYCDISIGAEVIEDISDDFLYQDSLLLTDKKLNESELRNIDERSVVYLISDNNSSVIREENSYYISKYESVTNMVAELSQIYADVFNHSDAMSIAGSDLISVCSGDNFVGNIVDISKFIAKQIANIKHCKVLLISMRDTNPFHNRDGSGSIERLVYSFASDRNISMDYFFSRDEFGVYRLRSSERLNRVSRMSSVECNWLIGKLSELFPVIVLHIGNSFSEDNLARIKNSKAVFCIGIGGNELKDIMPDYPSEKYCELMWNQGGDNSEMAAVDYIEQLFG